MSDHLALTSLYYNPKRQNSNYFHVSTVEVPNIFSCSSQQSSVSGSGGLFLSCLIKLAPDENLKSSLALSFSLHKQHFSAREEKKNLLFLFLIRDPLSVKREKYERCERTF